MKRELFAVFAIGAALIAQTALSPAQEVPVRSMALVDDRPVERDFHRIFNGKDLTGWDGNPKLWSVKDGAITGQTTADKPGQGQHLPDLDQRHAGKLRVALFLQAHSGRRQGLRQLRHPVSQQGFRSANWVVGGYQADMEAGATYTGILYEERMRGIMALRGEKVVWDKDGKKQVVGSVGKAADIQAAIKQGDWNEYVIIAEGNHLRQFINGKPTVDVTDDDSAKQARSGVLALQLHAGRP